MCALLWRPYSTDRWMPHRKFSLVMWNNSAEDRMDFTASFVELWSKELLKRSSKSAETVCTSWCGYQPLLWKKLSETPHIPAAMQNRGKPRAQLNSHFDSQSHKFRKRRWIVVISDFNVLIYFYNSQCNLSGRLHEGKLPYFLFYWFNDVFDIHCFICINLCIQVAVTVKV